MQTYSMNKSRISSGNCITDFKSLLPPLFEMDDYLSCIQDNNNQYCNVEAKLDMSDTNEHANQIIQQFTDRKWTFDRRLIHRALCLPKDVSSLYTHSERIINEKIENFNFSAKINDVTCIGVQPEMTVYDLLCLSLIIIYVSLVLFSTYNGKTYKNEKGIKKVLSNLSLVYTWKRRTALPTNEDYSKLLGMQGIRVISIVTLIVGHSMLGFCLSFLLNSTEYEELFSYTVIRAAAGLFILVVLNFFLLSSWLLTLQVYNVVEKHGHLSLKHAGILVLNRYFRLFLTVGVIMVVGSTSLVLQLAGPSNFSILVLNQRACQQNWLSSLLFLSNFQHILDICNPVTWYISADFQLYVITVAILYIKFKLNLHGIKFYSAILAGSCILHFILLSIFDVEAVFIPTLRNMELGYFKRSTSFLLSYMSTISIASSSIVGIIIAHLYSKTKNLTINKSKLLTTTWVLVFFGLPALTIFLSSIEVDGYKAAIMGIVVRPLYTTGVGLGIWGMSHNIGGPIKKLLEGKYVVLLSNFTYCVYLTHFLFIVIVHRYTFSPLYVNFGRLVQDSSVTIIISFVCGIFLTLGVEEPGMMLQKKCLPQITKWVQKTQEPCDASSTKPPQ